MSYSIKAAAEKFGLTPNTLRFYEKEGLLPHVERSQSGIRRYTDEDLEWLSLICCLKNTGMGIKQIREFVNLTLLGPETLYQRCQLLRQHKAEVEGRIAEMQQLLQKVSWKIGYFEGQYQEYQKGKEKAE
ncbi:MAG: MerR family transcriptional regulator [Clostridia bacterium]|nr:MerR family transcriptional regulator [Clostridia bacterium]